MTCRVSHHLVSPWNHGFSALELLVIVVIIAAVVAVGVPTLHSNARCAILDANLHSLASLVQTEMISGYDATYQTSGGGSPQSFLSNRLEAELCGAAGSARYVNPLSDPSKAVPCLNSGAIPADPDASPPAVYITNRADCRYDEFDEQPQDFNHLSLAGTLVIHFNTTARTVDVFYVDSKGRRSPDVIRLPAA